MSSYSAYEKTENGQKYKVNTVYSNKIKYFQSLQNISNFKKVFQFFLHLQYYEQTAHLYDGHDHTVNNGKEKSDI